ncbi:MAG: hypothetical protein C0490_07290 [Marivirga sp.]|nr:hypothetical protein [Marivirga sp.]
MATGLKVEFETLTAAILRGRISLEIIFNASTPIHIIVEAIDVAKISDGLMERHSLNLDRLRCPFQPIYCLLRQVEAVKHNQYV